MESIKIRSKTGDYEVIMGSGLDDMVFEYIGDKRALVVTDANVMSIYEEKIKNMLPNVDIYIIKGGEKSKNMDTIVDLCEYMSNANYDRRSILVSIGGGVVGDITGFLAAVYARGIDYIHVPTTLLSQVDSSIGGKTGVNLNGIKNVVGAFYNPKVVISDVNYYKTLPDREIICGFGEIVKTSLLDENLFNFIEKSITEFKNGNMAVILTLVKACASIKAAIVEQDETERNGIRKKLNVGHTIGHAIETTLKLGTISHGECVLRGIYIETLIAEKLKKINPEYKQRILSIISNILGKEMFIYDSSKIVSVCKKDKKNVDGKINFIIGTNCGEVEEIQLSAEELKEILLEIENEN